MSTPQVEPKDFEGRLLFDGGQVCEGVDGEIQPAPHLKGEVTGRREHEGWISCAWTRSTLELLGRQATLETNGGLKARIAFRSIVDEAGGNGATISFGTVGSALAGSFDAP